MCTHNRCLNLRTILKLLAYLKILHAFLSSADFIQNQFYQKILSGILPVSNSSDPDQAQSFIGPKLDPYCSQMLSTDNTSGQRQKICALYSIFKT